MGGTPPHPLAGSAPDRGKGAARASIPADIHLKNAARRHAGGDFVPDAARAQNGTFHKRNVPYIIGSGSVIELEFSLKVQFLN